MKCSSKYDKLPKTMFFFDFDDALCPTTWLMQFKKKEMSPDELKELKDIDEAAARLVSVAQSFGHVDIITASATGWVANVTCFAMPVLASIFLGLESVVGKPGNIESITWKEIMFEKSYNINKIKPFATVTKLEALNKSALATDIYKLCPDFYGISTTSVDQKIFLSKYEKELENQNSFLDIYPKLMDSLYNSNYLFDNNSIDSSISFKSNLETNTDSVYVYKSESNLDIDLNDITSKEQIKNISLLDKKINNQSSMLSRQYINDKNKLDMDTNQNIVKHNINTSNIIVESKCSNQPQNSMSEVSIMKSFDIVSDTEYNINTRMEQVLSCSQLDSISDNNQYKLSNNEIFDVDKKIFENTDTKYHSQYESNLFSEFEKDIVKNSYHSSNMKTKQSEKITSDQIYKKRNISNSNSKKNLFEFDLSPKYNNTSSNDDLRSNKFDKSVFKNDLSITNEDNKVYVIAIGDQQSERMALTSLSLKYKEVIPKFIETASFSSAIQLRSQLDALTEALPRLVFHSDPLDLKIQSIL